MLRAYRWMRHQRLGKGGMIYALIALVVFAAWVLLWSMCVVAARADRLTEELLARKEGEGS